MNLKPLLSALFLLFVTTAFGTTIVPPDFTQLAQGADQILEGTVSRISYFEKNGGIFTTVTITADGGQTTELEFLGGFMNGKELRVSGSPRFRLGDEVFLFVKGNHTDMCPILGWGYGTFYIRTDSTGEKSVHRANGDALGNVAQVTTELDHHTPANAASTTEIPMKLRDFRAAVKTTREAKTLQLK